MLLQPSHKSFYCMRNPTGHLQGMDVGSEARMGQWMSKK